MAKFTIKELSKNTGIPEGTWMYWMCGADIPREKDSVEGKGKPPYLYDPEDILDWWRSKPFPGMSLKRYYSVLEKIKNLS